MPTAPTDLAPDGDIILIVGPQQAQIHVDSLFLRRTSKVFSAMFSPNFLEGQALKDGHISDSNPMEIPLPDDDPEALALICAVIQHRVDLIPSTLSPTKVYQVARTADKYDCTTILYYAITDRSSLLPSDLEDIRELTKLLAAAYLLSNTEAFEKITKALVLHYTGSFTDLADGDIGKVVPLRVFYLLEEQKTQLLLKIARILEQAKSRWLMEPYRRLKCDTTSRLQSIHDTLWMELCIIPRSYSISKFIEALKNIWVEKVNLWLHNEDVDNRRGWFKDNALNQHEVEGFKGLQLSKVRDMHSKQATDGIPITL